jgi:hypothetical protein
VNRPSCVGTGPVSWFEFTQNTFWKVDGALSPRLPSCEGSVPLSRLSARTRWLVMAVSQPSSEGSVPCRLLSSSMSRVTTLSTAS